MFKLIRIFDGVCSSAILINYLKLAKPEAIITWSNHTPEVKHGIDVNLIPPETKLLIVPDAGSGEFVIHKELHDKGIDVLILDHHPVSEYSTHAIVINNQLDDYPNKQLSGAAIVLKFTQYVDKVLGLNYSEEFYDICSLGLIGDAMLLNNKETKWIVEKGLSNIKSELFKELIKENVESGVELTPTVIAFKINPKINSLIRVGTAEELDGLMKAFLNHQEVTINPRLRREDKSETWARRMTRICNNTYSRQRKLRDKILEEIEMKIERDKLYENHFIVVEVEGEFEMNMSGYVAMPIVNKYKRPTIILRRNNDGKLVGSLRGYDPFMTETRDFLNSLQLFDWARGHQNACGVQLQPEMRFQLDDKIGEALVDIELDETHWVDFTMPSASMTESFIYEMESCSNVFGRGLEQPLYAITDIEVRAEDIQLIGKAQNVLKFNKGNIEYVQFSADPKLVEIKEAGGTLTLTVVGKTGVNVWLGNKKPQIIIEDVRIESVNKSSFGGFEF